MTTEDPIDPYRAPSASFPQEAEDDPFSQHGRPDYSLYSAGQVGLATFLGSPIAGFWLMASNYGALGRADKKNQALLWGAIATVGVFTLAFVLPDGFPSIVLTIGYTIGLQRYADAQQGNAFSRHTANGGQKHSSWRAAGIGLASMAVVFVLAFCVAFLLPASWL